MAIHYNPYAFNGKRNNALRIFGRFFLFGSEQDCHSIIGYLGVFVFHMWSTMKWPKAACQDCFVAVDMTLLQKDHIQMFSYQSRRISASMADGGWSTSSSAILIVIFYHSNRIFGCGKLILQNQIDWTSLLYSQISEKHQIDQQPYCPCFHQLTSTN